MRTKLLNIMALLIVTATTAVAQNASRTEQKRFNIFFDINSSKIDKAFKSNSLTLGQLKADCDSTINNGAGIPDTIYIHSTSSPEGPAAFNRRLAHNRALSTKAAVLNLIPQFEKSQFVIAYEVESWDALRQILLADRSFPQREQMLRVLSDSSCADNIHRALKQYSEGWEYYVNNHVYVLRNSAIEISVLTSHPHDEFTAIPKVSHPGLLKSANVVSSKVLNIGLKPVMPKASGPEKSKRPLYIAAKTNMLYDVAIVPNAGVEFYLGKNFSVAANWMYSWWKSDRAAWYWRTYGGDLGARYWFGKAAQKKPLTGHHVGLYGQIITYDFEAGRRGYLADRWTFGGGVEYGYSLPVARRLNIDFTLGVGYLGGELKEYLPIDGHYVWQATKYLHWLGPTKAEISLVWLIGYGNVNERR